MTALSIDEINLLHSQNEGLKKQNSDLQIALKELSGKYIKVLDLAKKNADSNEYCLQELEAKNEQLQNTLKEVLSIVQGSTEAPCLNIGCDCDNCDDECTDYGKSCMLKGLAKIEELVEKCMTM